MIRGRKSQYRLLSRRATFKYVSVEATLTVGIKAAQCSVIATHRQVHRLYRSHQVRVFVVHSGHNTTKHVNVESVMVQYLISKLLLTYMKTRRRKKKKKKKHQQQQQKTIQTPTIGLLGYLYYYSNNYNNLCIIIIIIISIVIKKYYLSNGSL